MTKRTKAKRIEAWATAKPGLQLFALLSDDGGLLDDPTGHVFTDPDDPEQLRPDWRKVGLRVARFVPADPLARLKEDVLRAARKVWRTTGNNADPKWLRAVHELEGAVERLERRKK